MDPRHLSPEQRRVLDLDAPDATADVVRLPSDQTAHGKSTLTVLALVQLLGQGEVDARTLESPSAAAAGFEVQHLPAHRGLVIVSTAGHDVKVRSLNGVGERAARLADGSAVVQLADDDVYVATAPNGGITFGVTEGALVVVSSSLGVEGIVRLHGDRGWIALAAEDWLKDVVDAHLTRETTWGSVTAAALLSRISAISADPERVDERVAQPRRWARSWSAAEQRSVTDLAVARVDRLLSDLERLERSLSEDALNDEIVDVVEDVCTQREVLQGVAALLWEAGALGRLPDALAVLDERGDAIAALLPVIADPSDLLEAAAALDADAWWTRPLVGA